MPNRELPEVRIDFSRLIYTKISKPMFELMHPDKSLPSPEAIKGRVAEYKRAWEAREPEILRGIMDAFNLEFYKPVLDVYLAPRVPTFSTPTIINLKHEPDQFIDTLAHELIHVLISDNKNYSWDDYSKIKESLYPDQDMLVYNHILVHAGLKYLWTDVMNEPERVERDKAAVDHNPPYKKAWEFVDKDGYQGILKKFKATVKALK